jgi:hypothetical protein
VLARGAVAAEALDGEPTAGGARDDVLLAVPAGQFHQRMQAGGDPGDADMRRLPPQRGGQPVPAPPVGEPGEPDLQPDLDPPRLFTS